MTRNLKSLGALVGALLALCGLMAQSTSAHTPATFTSEQNTTTITGELHSDYVATVTGRTITCDELGIHGHAVGTSFESLTLTPTLTGCTAFGFANAKITGFGHYGEGAANSCDITFHANASGDLVCPAGVDVTIEVGTTCIVHVPAQTGIKGFTFTTVEREGKHALTLHVEITDITGAHTDQNFLCPFSGSGEGVNTKATGAGVVWGEDPETGAAVGITWNPTVP